MTRRPIAAVASAPSSPHRRHAPEVQRRAHELELVAHLVQAFEAELPESQHLLDPGVGWLDDGLAPTVFVLPLLAL